MATLPPLPDLTRHFHPVLRAARLRKQPVRVDIGGRGYVLFRDATGAPRALLDRCAHRFAPLSRGSVRPDGTLQCRYHGWRFDADGEGRCPSQPSLKGCRVPALQLREQLGWLWLAAPEVEPATMPNLHAPADDFRFVASIDVEAAAPLHVVLDNFNEDEHTPFVHGRLGWTEQDAGKIDFETSTHDDRIEVRYAAPQRPSVLLPLIGIRDGDLFHNAWVVRFSPVHIVYDLHWSDAGSGAHRPLSLRFAIFFVPLDPQRTHIVSFVSSRWSERRTPLVEAAVHRLVWAIAYKEIFDDARWVRHLADTPYEHRGMRLNRYDEPLVRSRRLLDRLYFGRDEQAPRALGLAAG